MKKILDNPLGVKFALVLGLFILLQIPISMISGLISERSHRQDEVRSNIARSNAGEQRIIGPFIVVDYTQTRHIDGKAYPTERSAFVLPDAFELTADLDTFDKYRGIYQAHMYRAQTQIKGQFDLRQLEPLKQFDIDAVTLVVGIKDSRGLVRLDEMRLANTPIALTPGTRLNAIPQGFHSQLDINELDTKKPLSFDLNFLLMGMGKLQVTPIGNTTTVELASSWPHPSFVGDYLPVSSTISEHGFEAQWSSNNFSTNIAQLFQNCLSNNDNCDKLEQRQMGVSLVDPVDHYLKSHRAVNYSILVITLVFASFFLLELFQARPIHPIQYGFVGLALALFYSLLISLSEHIGFNWAYGVSVMVSTVLLSLYVGGMLSNRNHGTLFGAGLLTLYGMLFGLLQAENYALLMGTLLCLAVLGFVMMITRHVDWYSHTAKTTQETNAVNP